MGAKSTQTEVPKNLVVQQITIKQATRGTQDIDGWKTAITQFKSITNPNRVKFYDLIEDIVTDGQIEATWGKRQDQVLNKYLTFKRDGVEDPEINKLLNSSSMRWLIRDLHNAIAYGYTLIYVNSIYLNEEEEQYIIDYNLIPRKHVHPEVGWECISKEQTSATLDFLYKMPPISPYMIWAGDPYDMGLIMKAAQYVIYKRGDFGDWAQFAEMFGAPLRQAFYDGYDDKTRIVLENAMEAMASCSYIVAPKGTDIKFLDAVKGTAGDLYKTLYDACNDEISKTILGNTLTTDPGNNGSRALGEVHAGGENAKNESDQRFILSILNGKLKSILKLFGFNVTGGEIEYVSAGKDWTLLKTKWEVWSGIRQQTPISDDQIYEEFDIRKPDNYEELKALMDLGLNSIATPVKDPLNPPAPKPKNFVNKVIDFFV